MASPFYSSPARLLSLCKRRLDCFVFRPTTLSTFPVPTLDYVFAVSVLLYFENEISDLILLFEGD